MNIKMNIPFSPPDMSEVEAAEATKAILSGWITTGPRTKEFERKIEEYCGLTTRPKDTSPVSHQGVCLNSATAAMEMALRLIGIEPDDEVIVPAYTYTATASVTQHLGCKLIMVDSQQANVEMDYDKLCKAITPKTKAIIPVDLGGIVADYKTIMSIVNEKKNIFQPNNCFQERMGRIVVVADSAHGFGSIQHGIKTGSIADMTAFSFHAVKNLTTAEGGALVWNLPFGNEQADVKNDYYPTVPRQSGECWNELLYRMSQLLSLHGQNKDALSKTKLGAWEYDIIGPWFKCNMTDIMAGIGLAQLSRYENILERRCAIAKQYNDGFKHLGIQVLNHRSCGYCSPSETSFISEESSTLSNHHLYLVRLSGKSREETNRVIEQMAEKGIATNVHYKPLPMMTAYKALGFDIKNYPNAFRLYENEITLPLHSKLTDDEVNYVIENFVKILKND